MGSKTFQRAVDENGCSTEVVISSKSKFRTKLPVQKSTVTTPYGKVEVNLVYCSVLDWRIAKAVLNGNFSIEFEFT